MTDPTEAEVEAGARAMYEARWGGGNWGVLLEQRNAQFEVSKWLPMARAALTAAAQVREGAECSLGPDDLSKAPGGAADHIERVTADLGPLPIYGATEDPRPSEVIVREMRSEWPDRQAEDQGPDVLGMRKGEE